MKQVGWAYRDKRWEHDRWHVCGIGMPQPTRNREVKPVFIDVEYHQECFEFVEAVRDMIGAGYGDGHQMSDLLRILKARNTEWEANAHKAETGNNQ